MKILFTGMASSHCNPSENVSFFNTIAKAVDSYADITWAAPKLSWTKSELDNFDLIFFGFMPPTALSANKIYGAMHVLGLMFHSPKLRLVVDGQQIWQYKNSIELIKRDVSSLFTSFYSKRADYSIAREESNRKYIDLASKYFTSEIWPTTYYPTLPWTDHNRAVSALGFGTPQSFVGINLDSLLLNNEPYSTSSRTNYWSVDDDKGVWIKKLNRSLRNPVQPLKVGRTLSDTDALATMRNSIGALIAPQDRGVGTWWTYRYIQALNSNTPIVTDWTDTISYRPCWSYLAYQVEDMPESRRVDVAKEQLETYRASLKDKKNTIEGFKRTILELDSERI
jgi:hypothetical protein